MQDSAASWRGVLRASTHLAFAAFLVLSLATGVQYAAPGPFNWGAPLGVMLEFPIRVRLLSLLPVLVGAGWLVSSVLERPRRSWHWGRPALMLPLLGLTVLAVTSLGPATDPRTALEVFLSLGSVWFVALFIINQRPNLSVPLALVLLMQGGVGVGQFLSQGDVGLAALGEPALDPSIMGISVVGPGDERWLRAHGLTLHPNRLGAFLAVLLLILLPAHYSARGWPRHGLALAILMGFLGLLVSFSRASWLAFGLGLLVWIVRRRPWHLHEKSVARIALQSSRSILGALLLVSVGFFAFYPELILVRFLAIDSRLEYQSVTERLQSPRLAVEIVGAHPWRGVGAGNYEDAAGLFDPGALPVHIIPLLAAAELGLPGAALWLWLNLVPLVHLGRKRASPPEGGPGHLDALAPWVAYLILGLLDWAVWPLAFFRGGLLLGLLLGYLHVAADDPHAQSRSDAP